MTRRRGHKNRGRRPASHTGNEQSGTQGNPYQETKTQTNTDEEQSRTQGTSYQETKTQTKTGDEQSRTQKMPNQETQTSTGGHKEYVNVHFHSRENSSDVIVQAKKFIIRTGEVCLTSLRVCRVLAVSVPYLLWLWVLILIQLTVWLCRQAFAILSMPGKIWYFGLSLPRRLKKLRSDRRRHVYLQRGLDKYQAAQTSTENSRDLLIEAIELLRHAVIHEDNGDPISIKATLYVGHSLWKLAASSKKDELLKSHVEYYFKSAINSYGKAARMCKTEEGMTEIMECLRLCFCEATRWIEGIWLTDCRERLLLLVDNLPDVPFKVEKYIYHAEDMLKAARSACEREMYNENKMLCESCLSLIKKAEKSAQAESELTTKLSALRRSITSQKDVGTKAVKANNALLRGESIHNSVSAGLSPVLRLSRLERALEHFEEALSYQRNKRTLLPVAKVSWDLATMFAAKGKQEKATAKKHYFRAIDLYAGIPNIEGPTTEVTDLEICYQKIQQWIRRVASGQDDEDNLLYEAARHLPDGKLKCTEFLHLGRRFYEKALELYRSKKYKHCRRLLEDCNFPTEEAKRLSSRDPDVHKEANILEQEIYLQSCVTDGRIKIEEGDRIYRRIIDNMDANPDEAWRLLDTYKQAEIDVRTIDCETESLACHKIALVYDKIFKMPARGKGWHEKALKTAGLISKSESKDWITISEECLREFEKQLNPDAERERKRKMALKEMESELGELAKLAKKKIDTTEFLKMLHERWPPKGCSSVFDDTRPVKKALFLAIRNYHPDKQAEALYGQTWHYFSDEITKRLTQKLSELDL